MGKIADRPIEVGVVENIKRLSADLELRTFPPGNTEVFHDR